MRNPGQMNKKIEIVAMGFSKDELNQEIRKEIVVAKVWAKARLIQSSENTKNYKNSRLWNYRNTERFIPTLFS